MGGGGSSSGGGGSDNITILGTDDLVSEREGNRQAVDDTLTVLRDVYDQYGVTVDPVVAKIKEAGTMAYYASDGTLGINKSYFDPKKMDSAYDRCVDKGFHPPRGNKSGTEAVVSHESGHALNAEAARRRGETMEKAARNILKDAKKEAGTKSVKQLRDRISGYAKKNDKEAIAEAFADVYCNGRKARKESRAIVNSLNRYLGGRP